MIISASRRTDICAFHSEWFMNRLKAGYALVRNPAYRSSVLRVPLTPDQVDLIVFITKDPSPMLAHLERIVKDYPVSFQITVTPYGKDLEPNVPDTTDIIRSFCEVSDIIGSERTVWRYDPVILNDTYTLNHHLEHFNDMCFELSGHTKRCIFSFLEYHMKLDASLGDKGIRVPTDAERKGLVSEMDRISSEHGITLSACCTDVPGVSRRSCIDERSMNEWNIPYSFTDVPNRKGCGCVRTIDIGEYDTCMHDCSYCYANGPDVSRRHERYFDPGSELLYGNLLDSDEVIDMPLRRQSRLF